MFDRLATNRWVVYTSGFYLGGWIWSILLTIVFRVFLHEPLVETLIGCICTSMAVGAVSALWTMNTLPQEPRRRQDFMSLLISMGGMMYMCNKMVLLYGVPENPALLTTIGLTAIGMFCMAVLNRAVRPQ